MKICTQCGLRRREASFHKTPGGRGGRMAHCKDCHRSYRQRRAKVTPHMTRDYQRSYTKRFPLRSLLQRAGVRARAAGIEFTVTEADVEMPKRCPLLDVELGYGGGMAVRRGSASLDRIDPTKGYVPGNVWVVSYRANRIKNDATLDELETLVANLRKKLAA